MKNKSLILAAPAILLIIFLTHLFLNVYWIKINDNQRMMGDDIFIHLYNNLTISYQLDKAIKEHSISSIISQLNSDAITNSGPVDKYAWPRLVYFVTAIFNLLFGISLPVSIISNMFWFLILIISSYFLGKYLFNEETGIFAAFLISFSPFIWGMSRKYGLDIPLTAITSLSMYLLFKTEGFRNRLYTILFFAALGIGFNVKMQIVLIFLAPVVINIFGKQMSQSGFEKCRNIFLGMMIFIGLSSLFWWGSIKEIWGLFCLQQRSGLEDTVFQVRPPWFSSLFFYLNYLIRGLNFVLVLSILGIYKMLRSGARKNEFLILSWAFIPVLIFSILNPQRGRFILPVLPVFCLLAASAVISLKKKPAKYFLIGSCFLVYTASLMIRTFNPANYGLKLAAEFVGYDKFIHEPDKYNIDIIARKFAHIIKKNNVQQKAYKIGILELAFPEMFDHDSVVILYNIRASMPGQFSVLEGNALRSGHITIGNFIKQLPSLDYLLVFTKDKEEIVNFNNFMSSKFYQKGSLNEEQQDLVKKYLADFIVVSKEQIHIRGNKFFLNLLIHK